MSAHLQIQTPHCEAPLCEAPLCETPHCETPHREPARSPRDREDILARLRQLMAQGARVVRLGRARRTAVIPARRPPAAPL